LTTDAVGRQKRGNHQTTKRARKIWANVQVPAAGSLLYFGALMLRAVARRKVRRIHQAGATEASLARNDTPSEVLTWLPRRRAMTESGSMHGKRVRVPEMICINACPAIMVGCCFI
jgi:hypothetical protein